MVCSTSEPIRHQYMRGKEDSILDASNSLLYRRTSNLKLISYPSAGRRAKALKKREDLEYIVRGILCMSASSAESKKSLLLSRPSPAQSCQPHPIPAPARPPLTPNWGQQLAPWPPHSNETWIRKRLSQPLTIPRFHLPAGWGGRRAPLRSRPDLE